MSTELDCRVKKAFAEDIVDQSKMVGNGGAVGTGVQTVDCVGDQGVQRRGGGQKAVDICGEGDKFRVKVGVAGEQGVELVLQICVKVDAGVPIIDQRLRVFQNVLVGLSVS